MVSRRAVLVAVFSVVWLFGMSGAVSADWSRTYTVDADFDEGVLVNVEHDTVPDQLQLAQTTVILPFIWVPSYDGTVSKVDTVTGNELGRYRTAPHLANPSRTTVDQDGACWVGNREAGTVVKVGLLEAGQYVDRNGNGVPDTSMDTNMDGDITGAELLPWGQDECVLFEVVLVPGWEGTYVPGTYAGPYDHNYWGVAPRGLAVDANNDVWAGTWSTRKFYHLDGATGVILTTLDMAPYGHGSYGAVIDGNGIMWSSSGGTGPSARIDLNTAPPTVTTWNPGHHTYGIGLDYLGHLFVSGWTSRYLSCYDIVTGVKLWTYFKNELYGARGVCATADNNVWVAVTMANHVARYDNNGILQALIGPVNQPTGVAVDAAGKVWVCDLGDNNIHRIDPATNNIDLTKNIVGSNGHYSYSDMTGIIARTITAKVGTWTIVRDSGSAGTLWGTISWNADVPPGTSIVVKARSSEDGMTWSPWETAANGVDLSATPPGRYIQVEATLKIITGEVSPILFDLTIAQAIIPVYVDIKPGSWPNPINCSSKGVISVAVCGTADFDVTTIDPATVALGRVGYADTVAAIRWSYEDVATPYMGPVGGGHDLNGDGFMDLVLKFKTQEVVNTLDICEEGGKAVGLVITGNLTAAEGGTPIMGMEVMRVVKPKGTK